MYDNKIFECESSNALAQRMALWGKKILWIDEYRMIKNNPLILNAYKPMEEYFVSDGWSGCNI